MVAVVAVLAAVATRHTYPSRGAGDIARRIGRVVPYVVVSTGMLPHQFSAFLEGLRGRMHAEFERTPKTAGAGGKRQSVRIHWPYVAFEAFFIAYQAMWTVVFVSEGLFWPAIGSAALVACVGALVVRYGDNVGRVLFVIDVPARSPVGARGGTCDTGDRCRAAAPHRIEQTSGDGRPSQHEPRACCRPIDLVAPPGAGRTSIVGRRAVSPAGSTPEWPTQQMTSSPTTTPAPSSR